MLPSQYLCQLFWLGILIGAFVLFVAHRDRWLELRIIFNGIFLSMWPVITWSGRVIGQVGPHEMFGISSTSQRLQALPQGL